ncbi:MAG TPA: deoxyguanosinetriphosphate triphosphohydrolase [Rhizobiaceae bacterium]|nr:deoxyguanosinetriphosphate triphosphohydrolase [Rhizobiaceae bacterium]
MTGADRQINSIGFGFGERAAYACDPWASRGRFQGERASATRTEFQRDRDRIVHSTAFRRLKHKTQVFFAHEGDHYRTRLTHTIEVAQIARALARALKLDDDLAEAIALVHDFGHTPFGHTGEDALNEAMAEFGGFDHNAQALRVVTRLERRYAEFDGLNLTWETLEGLVKHNGPLTGPHAGAKGAPQPILDYCKLHDLELSTFASLEAQVAAISDDIAYNTHDIDDGLRAGLLTLPMLREVPFLAGILDEIAAHYPHLDAVRTGHELTRRQITAMVEDVISTTQANLARLKPRSAADVRHAGEPIATFSDAMRETDRVLKRFMFANMYRHGEVMRVRAQAERIVRDLYDTFMRAPELMPGDWQPGAAMLTQGRLARLVADYIAGMTDNYAIAEHRRLFDHTPDLR